MSVSPLRGRPSPLKVQAATRIFAETGSSFDTTDIGRILTRPGSHDKLPSRPVDPHAFSFCKRTPHSNPNDFMKKGTGSGGMLVSKQAMSPTREANLSLPRASTARSPERKILSFAAYCPRPNPPNTELRR
jgi:hypothetical protein